MLNLYLNELVDELPKYELKYFMTPSLIRLKNVGYFCGMDYASKNVYNFSENITRFTHSISTSFIIDKLTHDKTKTIAGLYHDIATPCFSHVIDYMNKDYSKQETTEEYTERIIKSDEILLSYLKKDEIKVDDIINFKKFSIVDTERPKLCADRLDGIVLTSIAWTKNIKSNEIKLITKDMSLYKNEDNEEEIGFSSKDTAKMVVKINKEIDKYCHSNEDNYMMELLAKITAIAISRKYIKYDDLFFLNEDQIFKIFIESKDNELLELLNKFKTIKKEEIPETIIPEVKSRIINPLVKDKRVLTL